MKSSKAFKSTKDFSEEFREVDNQQTHEKEEDMYFLLYNDRGEVSRFISIDELRILLNKKEGKK